MMGRPSRRALRDEIDTRDAELRHAQELLQERSIALQDERRLVKQLEQRDNARRQQLRRVELERDGHAVARVERELLNVWDRLASSLEVEPALDEATGERVCRKIACHNRAEAAQLARKIRTETDYPEELEPYTCTICPPHPLGYRITHVRHVNRKNRGQKPRDYTERRAASALSSSVESRLSEDVRHKLVSRFAGTTVGDEPTTTFRAVTGELPPPSDHAKTLDDALVAIDQYYRDALRELGES